MPAAIQQERRESSHILASETGQRILLAAASVLLAWFLIELPALIHVIDYRSVIGPLHWYWATTVADRELLVIRRPNAHDRGVMKGGNITAAYNIPSSEQTLLQWDARYDRRGFRNETNLEQADIAVIGDSFVEATPIPTSQLMTTLLSAMERKTVANLGQNGYGPQQELVILGRYALPLKPHTIIWMFSESSDLADVLHYRNAIAATQHVSHSWSALWSDTWARSFANNALVQLKHNFSPKPSGRIRSGVLQSGNKRLTMYFVYPSLPFTTATMSALDETARIIADAHAVCVHRGVRLLFVFVPDKFRVLHAFCQFPRDSECRKWVINDLPERLHNAISAISSDVGYFDLTPPLIDGVQRGEIPYYPDDSHWSPRGHAIAASAIDAFLSNWAAFRP